MKVLSVKQICNVLVLSIAFLSLHSCLDSDQVGNAYYTFTGETVASYLQSNEDYSEFCQVLDTTDVIDLLSSYGTYTCFAPTNSAMKAYYADSGAVSMIDFLSKDTARLSRLREMAFYQIIDKKVYTTFDFGEGKIPDKNMMDRYILTSFKHLLETGSIMVNDSARILVKDIEVHNGVIHAISRVLVPSAKLLPEFIKNQPRFSLFSQALYETELSDKLLLERDMSYKQPTSYTDHNGKSTRNTPKERLYLFTALAEPDEVYQRKGIQTLSQLKAYAKEVYDEVYPEYAHIDDPTDPNNSLNRFVAYHLLDFQALENEFLYTIGNIIDLKNPRKAVEYAFPMAPYSMLEIRESEDENSDTPIFNVQKDGKCVRLVQRIGVCDNGVLHEIDDILVYDMAVKTDVLNKRLRIDAFANLPEATNVDLRWRSQNGTSDVFYPTGYFRNLSYTEDTKAYVPKINAGSIQYQGYMFYFYGWYDVTHNLPPIPAGTWEFRVGVKTRGTSICQVYVDGLPNGIPLDMSKNADHPEIGFIYDKTYAAEMNITEIEYRENVLQGKPNENDKNMRNRGWMKAPDYFSNPNGNKERSARADLNSLRRIMGRYDFEDGIQHTLRVKAVSMGDGSRGDTYFGYDYIEFIPTTQIENEDIF